jgi:hypothetical protein
MFAHSRLELNKNTHKLIEITISFLGLEKRVEALPMQYNRENKQLHFTGTD